MTDINKNIKVEPVFEKVKIKKEETLKTLNESVQIGDTVRLDGKKGFVIGELGGKIIVQIQGNTEYVAPSKVKENTPKPKEEVKPPMKFDEQTQKLLFEQMVRCAIYMDNVPIKLHGCYVKYSSWAVAQNEQQIKVMVEESPTFMPKSQVRLFEDINAFANEDNYIPGVIIDEETEDALENILLNAIDYSEAIGDADPVRIIKGEGEEQELQTLPKAALRTLSV